MVFDPNCGQSFGVPKAIDWKEAVGGADCIIIATDHRQFYALDLKQIKHLMKQHPAIVDGKRVIDPSEARAIGFDYVTTSCVSTDDSGFSDLQGINP